MIKISERCRIRAEHITSIFIQQVKKQERNERGENIPAPIPTYAYQVMVSLINGQSMWVEEVDIKLLKDADTKAQEKVKDKAYKEALKKMNDFCDLNKL